MESISCSLLKLLCLTPDLEPRSTNATQAALAKLNSEEQQQAGFDIANMATEPNGRVMTTTADSVAKASNNRVGTRSISRDNSFS